MALNSPFCKGTRKCRQLGGGGDRRRGERALWGTWHQPAQLSVLLEFKNAQELVHGSPAVQDGRHKYGIIPWLQQVCDYGMHIPLRCTCACLRCILSASSATKYRRQKRANASARNAPAGTNGTCEAPALNTKLHRGVASASATDRPIDRFSRKQGRRKSGRAGQRGKE